MSIRKYASVDLRVHRPRVLGNVDTSAIAKFGSFSFTPRPGYVYTRVRAISARINKNFDGFPSLELQKAAHTFNGRPVFVNHNNQDVNRTRGVILASQYHGLADDPHITILPEVDALTFPNLARDIIKGDMDSVSMGCDVDNSTCSYCGNVATTADEFCDHILNNKGQELTKLINGQPKRILVYEICRGLNFFEISFVFDPADETAVMQEVIVPGGVKMASTQPQSFFYNWPITNTVTTTGSMSTTSNIHLSYGEMIAPPKVDTLRDESNCPQCGSNFNGVQCDNCDYITPPDELQDPDTQKAGELRDEDGDGDNDDLDYFGDGNDSADEDEGDYNDDEDDEDEEEPNPYDLYNRQPRKEGNVSKGNAVQANVGVALAQRRLAEAQRRLRAIAFDDDNENGPEEDGYPLSAENVGQSIADDLPAAEAPAGGSQDAVAAPDHATTVDNLDQEAPVGSFGERVPVMRPVTSTRKPIRRRADDTTDHSNEAEAKDNTTVGDEVFEQQNVEAPVANQVVPTGQYDKGAWDGNTDNLGQNEGVLDESENWVPDGRGSQPNDAQKKEAMVLKKASASQVYQLADLYTELGLVPAEQKYAAIAEIEKMPHIVAAHTIKVLGRVKEVFSTQMPQGRVARTASTIPTLGKTASAGRTPPMGRVAESRRAESNAADTLLLF